MEESENESKKENIIENIESNVEQTLDQFRDGNIVSNIDLIGKLVDIHKDIKNEKYWKAKEEHYMYRERMYDDNDYGYRRRGVYNTGRSRTTGRYMRGNYRGEEMIDDMVECYRDYLECLEDMSRGNYGASSEMAQSVEGIMKNVHEIVMELSEADSPEVMQIIRKYAKKMSEM